MDKDSQWIITAELSTAVEVRGRLQHHLEKGSHVARLARRSRSLSSALACTVGVLFVFFEKKNKKNKNTIWCNFEALLEEMRKHKYECK